MTDGNAEGVSLAPGREELWSSALAAIYPQRVKRWENLKYISHYTSLANFERIVRSKHLLFSSVADMNDRDEVREAVFQVAEVLKSRHGSQLLGTLKQSYPVLFKHLDDYLTRAYLDPEIYGNVYCFCLSEHRAGRDDDGRLSMWRAYGGDGNGVAIVLAREQNEEANAANLPFEGVPVDYLTSSKLQARARAAVLDPLIAWQRQSYSLNEAQQHDIAYLIFKVVLMLSVSAKHRGFRDEAEWRLVYVKEPMHPAPPVGKLTAVSIGRRLRPVYQVALNLLGESSPWDGVREIIVGPSEDQEMHVMALTNLLCHDENWPLSFAKKIRPSNIPYRSRS